MAKAKPKTPEPPSPLVLDTTTQFDRDVKRQEKRGKSLDKLHEIVETLRTRRPVDPKHKDHPLGGEWKGWRDCHVEPDWVLIYRKDDVTLQLGRTGSHSDENKGRPHRRGKEVGSGGGNWGLWLRPARGTKRGRS